MPFKNWLFSCTAITLMCSPAFAQEPNTPPVNTNTTMDELVVFGSQLARKRAIDQKRDGQLVSDMLGVDELGQLPDKNVGESLNRLPGVSMLVEKGEGRYVQIRGINPALNNVTINGVQLGSPEVENGGRLAPLDIISGGVLGGVQVIKTPTPDMDAQGIGGTVNVDTKMPFDRDDDFYGYASARYGFEDISPRDEAYGGHNPFALDATASGKLADGKFGWLLGVNYSDREYIAEGIYQDDWRDVGGFALPEEVKNNYYVIGRKRLNVNGALEFRPNAMSRYYVRSFYATWDEFQHRNRYQQGLTQDLLSTGTNTGTSGPDRISSNTRLEEADKTLFSITGGGENTFDAFTLTYLAQANMNDFAEPNSYWEFRSGSDFGLNTWSVSDDGVVTVTPDASAPNRQDPDLIDLRRVRFRDNTMDEDTLIGQIDLKWDQSETTYFKVGAKIARTERIRDFAEERWGGGDMDLTLGTSDSFTNGPFTNSVGSNDVPNIWLDIDAMNAFFNDTANADYFELDEGNTFDDEFASDYDITETIYAGYMMGVKQMGPAEIIGGVRLEATDITSSGYLRSGGQAVQIESSGDYLEWMPALLVNLRPTDALVLRGAVTRALGRPNYNQIAPISEYEEEEGNGDLDIGNPGLKARTSWNFDVSLEWYPNDLSVLSAAVFYKDIGNEIISLSERYTSTADIDAALAARGLSGAINTGDLDELNISTTVNGGSSSLKGLEFNAQTQFAFLPGPFDGLGASASATFLDGSTTVNGQKLPLQGQPETTYAATLFYQKGPLDASMSYSYNASYLTDINLDDPSVNLDQGAFGRWDAKISYEVRKGLKLFIEGVNLGDEPTTEFQGGNKAWNTEYEYVGRTIYIGASFGFGG